MSKYRLRIEVQADGVEWFYPQMRVLLSWLDIKFEDQENDTGKVIINFSGAVGYDDRSGALEVIQRHRDPIKKEPKIRYEYL